MDLQELLERIGAVAEADSDALATLEQDILAAYAALRADEDRSDETIEALAQLADALDGVRARSEVLETERAEREQRLAEIDARVTPAAEDEPETPVAEDGPEDEATTPDESEPEAPAADEPVEVEVEAEPVPIAAAATGVVTVTAGIGPTPLARIARSRPQAFAPRQSENVTQERIIAAAEVPGFYAGAEIHGLDQLVDATTARLNGISSGQGRFEAAVATIQGPAHEHSVSVGASGDANAALLASVAREFDALVASGQLDTLVAAGGVCGPVAPYYQQNILGESSRPIASGLPGVGGDRGGIRFVPPPALSAIVVDASGGAIGLQTQEEDVANTQKTCQAVVCGVETEVKVEAIWSCLSFGNAGARFHPERVQAFVALARTAFARRAEQYLLSLIDTGSTAVASNTPVVGAVPDLLHVASQLASGIRSRNRMATDAPFQVIFPDWLISMAQADLALRGSVDPDAAFNVAQSNLEGWLRVRGLNPIWSPDRQLFGTQGLGGVLDFPNTVTWNLFPAGTFAHIDGGTLDLGVVRDSTLNADNRFQMFMEGWESVAKVGVTAYKITSNLCASGMTASGNDTDAICSGASFGS